ncbi:UNKNOWN [Stylonychia lemnae]|uniref:ZZ-type domain-containing protein n=1 Tax=Stylonychia lemnae TaxID=5949 RepID=A0A078ALY0_STYLE|nr:UNKNOWN [Stylonychia lemnae]|eukprot:CDW81868.1 UNKNOWN [Stylonychia lemnae]
MQQHMGDVLFYFNNSIQSCKLSRDFKQFKSNIEKVIGQNKSINETYLFQYLDVEFNLISFTEVNYQQTILNDYQNRRVDVMILREYNEIDNLKFDDNYNDLYLMIEQYHYEQQFSRESFKTLTNLPASRSNLQFNRRSQILNKLSEQQSLHNDQSQNEIDQQISLQTSDKKQGYFDGNLQQNKSINGQQELKEENQSIEFQPVQPNLAFANPFSLTKKESRPEMQRKMQQIVQASLESLKNQAQADTIYNQQLMPQKDVTNDPQSKIFKEQQITNEKQIAITEGQLDAQLAKNEERKISVNQCKFDKDNSQLSQISYVKPYEVTYPNTFQFGKNKNTKLIEKQHVVIKQNSNKKQNSEIKLDTNLIKQSNNIQESNNLFQSISQSQLSCLKCSSLQNQEEEKQFEKCNCDNGFMKLQQQNEIIQTFLTQLEQVIKQKKHDKNNNSRLIVTILKDKQVKFQIEERSLFDSDNQFDNSEIPPKSIQKISFNLNQQSSGTVILRQTSSIASQLSQSQSCNVLLSTEQYKFDLNSNYTNPLNSVQSSTAVLRMSVHRGFKCMHCNDFIYGIRYQCQICANQSICQNCEGNGSHQDDHILLKIKNPISIEGSAQIHKEVSKEEEPDNDSKSTDQIVKDNNDNDCEIFKNEQNQVQYFKLSNSLNTKRDKAKAKLQQILESKDEQVETSIHAQSDKKNVNFKKEKQLKFQINEEIQDDEELNEDLVHEISFSKEPSVFNIDTSIKRQSDISINNNRYTPRITNDYEEDSCEDDEQNFFNLPERDKDNQLDDGGQDESQFEDMFQKANSMESDNQDATANNENQNDLEKKIDTNKQTTDQYDIDKMEQKNVGKLVRLKQNKIIEIIERYEQQSKQLKELFLNGQHIPKDLRFIDEPQNQNNVEREYLNQGMIL